MDVVPLKNNSEIVEPAQFEVKGIIKKVKKE